MDATVPVRYLSARFFHQGPISHPLVTCSDPASTDARYQRRGGPGVWYGSTRERGAWAELFRHLNSDELNPFEVRRRVGSVLLLDLPVLDLTDSATRRALNLSRKDLVADDYSPCQDLADLARLAGFGGILAPSAAMIEVNTVAVFISHLNDRHVKGGASRVQRPPVHLVDVLHKIRPVPFNEKVAVMFRRLQNLGKGDVRSGF